MAADARDLTAPPAALAPPVPPVLRPAGRFVQVFADEVMAFKDEHHLSEQADYVLIKLLFVVDFLDGSLSTTKTALGEYLGMNRTAVRRCLDELADAGAVRWTQGPQNGRLEVLVYDRLVNCQEARRRAISRGGRAISRGEPRDSARYSRVGARLTRDFAPLEVEVGREEETPLRVRAREAGPGGGPAGGGEEVLLRNDEDQDQPIPLPSRGDDPPEREELLALTREGLERAAPALVPLWGEELRLKPRSVTRLVVALAGKRQAGWDVRAMLDRLVLAKLPPRIDNSLVGLLATRVERQAEVPGGLSPAPAGRSAPSPSTPAYHRWAVTPAEPCEEAVAAFAAADEAHRVRLEKVPQGDVDEFRAAVKAGDRERFERVCAQMMRRTDEPEPEKVQCGRCGMFAFPTSMAPGTTWCLSCADEKPR